MPALRRSSRLLNARNFTTIPVTPAVTLRRNICPPAPRKFHLTAQEHPIPTPHRLSRALFSPEPKSPGDAASPDDSETDFYLELTNDVEPVIATLPKAAAASSASMETGQNSCIRMLDQLMMQRLQFMPDTDDFINYRLWTIELRLFTDLKKRFHTYSL